jgi:molybdenum cofactor guanylyltransferase
MPQQADFPSVKPSLDGTASAFLPGLILAGGRSSRMGETKAFLTLRPGETILQRIIDRLTPQVTSVLLNAPADFGLSEGLPAALPRIPDRIEGQLGPLAGVVSGLMHVASSMPQATHLLTVPSDSPFLPADLAEKLSSAIDTPEAIAVATCNGRLHPVFALWPVAIAADMATFIEHDEKRRMNAFLIRHRTVIVDFPEIPTGCGPLDPFYNINTPEELAEARRFAEDIACEDMA